MANFINTNIAAYYAQTNITRANNNASSSISRLSSGNRIVKASDDVAALSVGTSLRTQVTSLRTALLNANQGSSLLQVADGAMSQVIDILQRQKAIATQATSGSLTSTERGYLNQEFQALATQINQIATGTNFNGVNLLNGGLGNKLRLANTDALAAAFNPAGAAGNTGTSIASTVAVQAFDVRDGTDRAGTGTAGFLDLADSAGTVLTNGAFDSANSGIQGRFEKFEITDVVFTVAATIKATINGITFSGTVAEGATTALLRNGTSYINIGMTALTTTDAGTVQASLANLYNDFSNTVVMRTNQVEGVSFTGTRLDGAIGAAATGVAMVRLADSTRADISNFRYLGNTGAADTNIMAVDVNGQTFTANVVLDLVDGAAAAVYTFEDGKGQALVIDITGHNANGDAAIGNIRTNLIDRQAFVDALNIAFSRAGGGLSFGIGSTADEKIAVQIKSASTTSLYGGESFNVNTAADATAASNGLDRAIRIATSIRADIGGLQSRFNFASANLESSIQNQDAARGVLLDTDVATESTAYSTAQAQMQAGISVLAQANQLTQSLLKLIG